MNDIIIFGFGVFVTSLVTAAVVFLFWGVSNEPSIMEVPDEARAAHPLPHNAVPRSVSKPSSGPVSDATATV